MVDDLVSMQPFIARAMRVYGDAEPPIERTGMVGAFKISLPADLSRPRPGVPVMAAPDTL